MSGAAGLPIWTCELAPPENMTVGVPFKLSCHGDIEVAWIKDAPVGLSFAKKDEDYTLNILKTESLSANAAEFTVTAYKAGEHKPEYVRVVQRQGPVAGAEVGFEFAKPTWTVATVLKKDQKNEPYPPFGPWNLTLPTWLWFALGLLLVTVGYFVVRQWRKHNQRQKVLLELARHKTALSPLHQYYRDARQLRRRLHNVKQAEELSALSQDMNREFRLYVLRQFLIPTLDWSDGQIVRDMKRRHKKVYRLSGDILRKTLREFTRLQDHKQLLFKDLEQMQRISMEAVEKIDRAKT